MTVNAAGRGRRRDQAAAVAEPAPKPATRRRAPASRQQTTTSEPADRPVAPGRQTGSAARAPLERLAARPYRAPTQPATSAPLDIPREAPAVLHPSDRRGFAAPRLSLVGPPEQLAIGEIDQTLFDCPVCRRPLALGTHRCPGCGTRLIRSVPLRKAASFVATGLLAGAVGGFGGGLVITGGLSGAGAAAAIVAQASPNAGGPSASASSGTPGSPSSTVPPSSSPPPTPTVEPIPSVVRSALSQALDMNARLAAAEVELRAALSAPAFDATAVAQTMRGISADMIFAEQVAVRVGTWSGSGTVGEGLAAFYGRVHESAGAALVNSVRNAAAYRAAARSMADLLAGHTALDQAIRASAAAAGVDLPEPSPAL